MGISKTRLDHLQEFDNAPEWAWFSQDTVAAVRGCSEATLERDRWAGIGIPFLRDGRSVRYVKRNVLEYLAQQTPSSPPRKPMRHVAAFRPCACCETPIVRVAA